MVPADKHDQALAILSYEQLLPADSKSGFDDIIKMTNPFDTDKKSDLMFTRARAAELAQIINEWHGVADARSSSTRFTNTTSAIPSSPAPSSASARAGKKSILSTWWINAASSTVASATSGMDRSRVSVIIDGRAYKPHDDSQRGISDGGDGDLYEQTESAGAVFRRQNRQGAGGNYTDPLISVSVSLDVQSKVSTSTAYDPKDAVQKEAMHRQPKPTRTTRPPPAASRERFPMYGASVNTGNSSGGTSTSTEPRTKAEFTNAIGSVVEQTVYALRPAAGHLPRPSRCQGAISSISIRQMNPGAKPPDEDTLRKCALSRRLLGPREGIRCNPPAA